MLDCKCSHHKKGMIIMGSDRGVSNARVIIILQCINVSNQHVVHLKFFKSFISIISQ